MYLQRVSIRLFEIALWLSNFAEVDLEYERLSKLGVQFPQGAPITYPFGIRQLLCS